MNRFQQVVLYGTVANVLLLLIFPPYDVIVFGRGAVMFDAFHPVFAAPGNRVINGDLLYLLLMAVLVNGAIGWLVLSGPRARPELPHVSPQTLVIGLGLVNLVAVALFPPMEAYAFAQRITVGTFDGFYFAFGDKAKRSIFVPLLYLEVLYVLVNACAFWLAMGLAARAVGRASGPLTMLAQAESLRMRAEAQLRGGVREGAGALERGEDRRKSANPLYAGPERRAGELGRRDDRI